MKPVVIKAHWDGIRDPWVVCHRIDSHAAPQSLQVETSHKTWQEAIQWALSPDRLSRLVIDFPRFLAHENRIH